MVPVIDWRQMQRWGIARSRLPAGSQIVFREPSAWERYKVYIVGAVTALLAQAALIAGLLIHTGETTRGRASSASKSGGSCARVTSGFAISGPGC